jgi:hypothetical protein
MFVSQELQRIHISTNYFTKMITQLCHYECHIMMHVVMSVMLKIIFWSMKVRMSPLGNICSVFAMSSIYHVIFISLSLA